MLGRLSDIYILHENIRLRPMIIRMHSMEISCEHGCKAFLVLDIIHPGGVGGLDLDLNLDYPGSSDIDPWVPDHQSLSK
jgi:hypothetical protein